MTGYRFRKTTPTASRKRRTTRCAQENNHGVKEKWRRTAWPTIATARRIDTAVRLDPRAFGDSARGVVARSDSIPEALRRITAISREEFGTFGDFQNVFVGPPPSRVKSSLKNACDHEEKDGQASGLFADANKSTGLGKPRVISANPRQERRPGPTQGSNNRCASIRFRLGQPASLDWSFAVLGVEHSSRR